MKSHRCILLVVGMALIVGCSEELQPENVVPPAPEAPAAPDEPEESEEAAAAVEKTPVAFNVEGAPTVVFDVPDMMCETSCVPTVQETLAEQPGVKDVKVELEGKQATVAVDEEVFNADATIAALVDLQFTKTKLATDAAPADNATATQ